MSAIIIVSRYYGKGSFGKSKLKTVQLLIKNGNIPPTPPERGEGESYSIREGGGRANLPGTGRGRANLPGKGRGDLIYQGGGRVVCKTFFSLNYFFLLIFRVLLLILQAKMTWLLSILILFLLPCTGKGNFTFSI